MIIFEDSNKSPISRLLVQLMGSKCTFAKRNENMADIIYQYLDSGEDIVCYVDCVPDNKDLIDLYNELKAIFRLYPQVHILRIPCIEFIALQVCLSLNALDRNNPDVKKFYASLVGDEIDYKAKSYERFCKGVLNSSRKLCVRNTEQYGLMNFISWYESDCDCDDIRFSKNCSRYSLLQKVLALAYYIPYYENSKKIESFVESGLLRKRGIKEATEYCEGIYALVEQALNNRKEV